MGCPLCGHRPHDHDWAFEADAGYKTELVVTGPRPELGKAMPDGKVDLLDLQLLSRDWLKLQSGLTTDLDGSGKVDSSDFSILGDNWSTGN